MTYDYRIIETLSQNTNLYAMRHEEALCPPDNAEKRVGEVPHFFPCTSDFRMATAMCFVKQNSTIRS